MHLGLVLVATLMIAPTVADDAGPADPAASLRAENKLLRSTVERQAKEIEKLQGRMDLMLHRMKLLGVTEEQLEAADPPRPEKGPVGEAGPANAGADARVPRTVFLVDASGSMINQFGRAKVEVLKAVRGLQPDQFFGVVFAQDERADVFHPSLVRATPENVRKFAAFLDGYTTTGTTNMIPGLEKALKLRPSALWVVTDGDFPDNQAMLNAARRLNRGGCRINTMLMGKAGDVPAAMVEVLRDLARQNGGACYDSTGKRLGPSAPAATAPPPKPREPKFGTMRDEDLPSGPSIFQEHSDEGGEGKR